MKISIFGLGYVGSVSSACFSLMGHEVVGVDSKIEKNEMINSGKAPIFENNLNDIINNHRGDRLKHINDNMKKLSKMVFKKNATHMNVACA